MGSFGSKDPFVPCFQNTAWGVDREGCMPLINTQAVFILPKKQNDVGIIFMAKPYKIYRHYFDLRK
ncbi:MAG: hypothetical protein WCW14_00440 [Candidatus Paceibacterota bacterium]|jgi:hypothetical protein